MRIAYLDCFAGISGDLFLGAMIDAGVPPEVLHHASTALDLGASLKIEKVDRSGISCTKVHVFEGDSLAEGHAHSHNRNHSHPSHTQDHQHAQDEPHSHTHVHGRSLSAIRTLIQGAPLVEPVKRTAICAFELLGQSEARIHNIPVDEIHFHEVGAVDAIVDIVAASAAVHYLEIGAWYCSLLNVGGGTVVCAHGTFLVPAPATADLLRGVPTYSAHVQKELVTPTGAALLRALDPAFGQQPAMKVEQIGYGAGTRNPADFPNVLRMSIGEAVAASQFPSANSGQHARNHKEHGGFQGVTVIETALDDLSPQVLAHVAEAALAMGALDVMLTPVIMKKGRPGTLLTVLCNESESGALQHLILSETSTLGVRIRQDRRVCLDRSHTTVGTEFGEIRMKIGALSGQELNAAPEFEDCRTAAMRHHVPVKQVQQAAIAAHRHSSALKEESRQ